MAVRVVKFRAWSKTQKKMLDRVLAGPGDPCSIVWDEERKDWVQFDDACGEIMQFTGLLDKNGREIYEGDIVFDADIGVQGVVTWVITRPGFVILNEYKTGAFVLHDAWEVIGNIYENPEMVRAEWH